MSSRSLNKVQLIGNLTRDPELRYTPQGTAVCTLGLATNRSWATEGGEKREETEFHRIVAWNKLAELCSQLLFKGRKVYVEGRLQTRTWTAQDGTQRQATEVVIEEMIILDSKQATEAVPQTETVVKPAEEPVLQETAVNPTVAEEPPAAPVEKPTELPTNKKKAAKTKEEAVEEKPTETVVDESADLAKDIPF
ncbi:single-stranded DNA-binding protein [Candidatus Shapirobacteria bacterium CG09_land_8_20_14_0_10_39_12]|uniref:Single-stranded DNA-binding protein n=1 Tax=Candidatus Shapirobacteria bacterium CG09_land_8_20_14_0_10_39_12 TaxID=1974885 RepID=A0A2H0WQ77_9BACT|nr:MAG: single-stranded DNA-binding protein [Candidatus Shapirobacteria bacterium CG09_land_8_20_14_0_10_39_12]